MMNRSVFQVEANANGNILAETMKKTKQKRNDTVKQLTMCVMCTLRAGAFVQDPRRNR